MLNFWVLRDKIQKITDIVIFYFRLWAAVMDVTEVLVLYLSFYHSLNFPYSQVFKAVVKTLRLKARAEGDSSSSLSLKPTRHTSQFSSQAKDVVTKHEKYVKPVACCYIVDETN